MGEFALRPSYRSGDQERAVRAGVAWLTYRTDLPPDSIFLRIGSRVVTHLKDYEVDQLIEGLTALRERLGKTCPACQQVVPS